MCMYAVVCRFFVCVREVQGITFPCDKVRVISVCTKKVLSSPLPFTLMIPRHEHMYPKVCKICLVSLVTWNNDKQMRKKKYTSPNATYKLDIKEPIA